MKITWKEVVLLTIVTPPGLMVMLWMLGRGIDTRTDYVVQHERCLKATTNGYDAEQCRR